ncbi:MAG: hypothetical protein AAFY85_03615, partial [Pseudomonadota bacterium]
MAAAANVQPDETRIHLAGQWVFPLAQGALWWPDQQVLVVSDLHLEKGSSYARRGQMLPPSEITLPGRSCAHRVSTTDRVAPVS